jgi:RHS repeat-associated protein
MRWFNLWVFRIYGAKKNGQLVRVESQIGANKQWTQKFSYDSIGRLSESKEYRGDTNALTYKQKFDYDKFGNLYRKNASNPTAGQENPIGFAFIEDTDISKATNRFTTQTTYDDDAGNVITDNKFRTSNFAYDANGRMVKATKASLPDASSVYDASGMRVAEQVNDVWRFLIYDIGGKLIAEYGGLQATDEGGVKYLFSDWQGSTRAIVSNSGYVSSRMDYTAFGEDIQAGTGLRTTAQGFNSNSNLRQKYGLTERDEATGLDHTWFRKNENRAGRWTSPDPYNGSATQSNPQSWNRYSYVGNQPTNFVDPSGLQVIVCTTWYRYSWENTPGGPVGTLEIIRTECREIGGGGGYIIFGGGSGPNHPPREHEGGGLIPPVRSTSPFGEKNKSEKDKFVENCLKERTKARVRTLEAERQIELDTNLLWSMGPTNIGIFDVGQQFVPDSVRKNKNAATSAALAGMILPPKAAAGVLFQ